MYTSPKVYNSLPPLTQSSVNLSNHQPRHNGWAIATTLLAIGLAVVLLIYTGGMGSLLKLLGVGASGVYEMSITTANDFLGIGKPWLVSSANLNGVNAFTDFSIVPEDVDVNEKGKGFILPIYSSPADPTAETYQEHIYTTPGADFKSPNPYLSAIQITYYQPTETSINYAYRTSSSVEGLNSQPFMLLDLTLIQNLDSGIKVGAAMIEQTVNRYIQVQITLISNTALKRAAIYAINFQFYPEAKVTNVSELSNSSNGELVNREIVVQYESLNAPTMAEVNILSADVNDAVVYSTSGVDLSARLAFSIQTNLISNKAYALTISAPLMNTVIIPFNVGSNNNIKLNAGSFTMSTGSIADSDRNGDGVINTVDYLLMQYQSSAQ